MNSSQVVAFLFAISLLFSVGCSTPRRYSYAPAPPPPPPPRHVSIPPLMQEATREGFRFGSDAGLRDAYRGIGYHPTRGHAFHNTPGYDPSLGPYEPYRDAFRSAYVQGYDRGFYRR